MSDQAGQRSYVEFLVYGKIIIDGIRLRSGTFVHGVLGGGGPQAAFGARLWTDSVGFLSRSGEDIEEVHVQSLQDLALDLAGWRRFAGIPTARGNLAYDENEVIVGLDGRGSRVFTQREDWFRLLAQPLPIPAHYQQPTVFHLITEFHDEPMVGEALRLRDRGAILSLEPLVDFRAWSNREGMLALTKQVHIVSPDWPTASGIAGSDDPRSVLQFWSRLGPELVMVRHGHHGSYAWDARNDACWHIPAVPVTVVDPTGAGNSYAGGACVGWAQAQDARVAGTYGAISASFLVARTGLPKMDPSLRHQARGLLEVSLSRASRL